MPEGMFRWLVMGHSGRNDPWVVREHAGRNAAESAHGLVKKNARMIVPLASEGARHYGPLKVVLEPWIVPYCNEGLWI